MNILLLGANGQLGRLLLSRLAKLGEVIAATRQGQLADGTPSEVADLASEEGLQRLLDQHRPDIIVNASAYTAVDLAESEEAQAFAINADGVAVLARWAASHGALVVHYSTDYVFDGSATSPYAEDAATRPLGVYGRSKLAGEQQLLAAGGAYLLFRTAWVYAPHAKNFLLTMLRLGAERDELRVVADQIGAPTTADLIASGTIVALQAWLASDAAQRRELEGIYHLTASGAVSWHGFATAIMQAAQTAGLIARQPAVIPITTAQFPTTAQRPAYSVLDNRKFQRTFDTPLPDWSVGLNETIASLAAAPSRG